MTEMSSSTHSSHISIISFSSFLKCFGTFVLYEVLEDVSVLSVIGLLYLFSSIFYVGFHRSYLFEYSWKSSHALLIVRQALLQLFLTFLWFYGLLFCGPLIVILLSSQPVSLYISSLLSYRLRSSIFLLGAILSLYFLDFETLYEVRNIDNISLPPSSIVSEHRWGILLLCLFLSLTEFEKWLRNKSGIRIGGIKILETLISLLTTTLLAFYILLFSSVDSENTNETSISLSLSHILYIAFSCITVKLLDFYVEYSLLKKMTGNVFHRWRTLMCIGSAFILSIVWTSSSSSPSSFSSIENYNLSFGVFFSGILLSTGIATSNSSLGTRELFIGYSRSGLPLYSLSSGSLKSTSFFKVAKESLSQIFEDSNSRRIFYFLCLNLSYTFIEFSIGLLTNSLGLLSDGFHMLFDCSSLLMGLYASVMTKWKPNKTFSFGYGRLEILSGFVNGLFLLMISINIFNASLFRFFDPPKVGTEKLFAVSLGGLLINLFGIFVFMAHGEQKSHEGHSHNMNIQGVLLHIVADTLGSVGVIISSLLIEHFEWYIADPVCSLFISMLIFASVIPLLKQSSQILLLNLSNESKSQIENCLQNLHKDLNGILNYKKACFWPLTSGKIYGSLSIEVEDSVDEQVMIDMIGHKFSLLENGIDSPTIQLEKSSFRKHLKELSSSSSALSLVM